MCVLGEAGSEEKTHNTFPELFKNASTSNRQLKVPAQPADHSPHSKHGLRSNAVTRIAPGIPQAICAGAKSPSPTGRSGSPGHAAVRWARTAGACPRRPANARACSASGGGSCKQAVGIAIALREGVAYSCTHHGLPLARPEPLLRLRDARASPLLLRRGCTAVHARQRTRAPERCQRLRRHVRTAAPTTRTREERGTASRRRREHNRAKERAGGRDRPAAVRGVRQRPAPAPAPPTAAAMAASRWARNASAATDSGGGGGAWSAAGEGWSGGRCGRCGQRETGTRAAAPRRWSGPSWRRTVPHLPGGLCDGRSVLTGPGCRDGRVGPDLLEGAAPQQQRDAGRVLPIQRPPARARPCC